MIAFPRYTFVCFLTFSFSLSAFAEVKPDMLPVPDTVNSNQTNIKSLIEEGNKLMGNGQFYEALPIWNKVVDKDSTNADANFKLGLCYFNTLDEQIKSLNYFKRATSAMTDKYNFYDAGNIKAPLDAIYFLGEAFLSANQPDSAYEKFRNYQDKYAGNPPIPVDYKLLMCVNAKKNTKAPRDVTLINMGDKVNSEYSETNPVLTVDNSVLFFSTRRLRDNNSNLDFKDNKTGKYREDIYMSVVGENGKWSKASMFKLSTDADEAPLYITPDGLSLYLRRDENGISNIYKSHYEDGVWSEPEKLGGGINSPFNETGLSISGDGSVMCFASDRVGGVGKSDIYICKKKKNGNWGAPENIGTMINTPYNEISPFIHPNSKTLFFSSDGNRNKGMGGFDIYYSQLQEDGTWGEPQSMGYPINTTRDDINYYITSGGNRFYSTINKDNSYDLFEIQGGGFAVENIDVGTEVVTLTKEMDVTDIMEVEKKVEKEVEVVETVETEVEVEKEVEVIDLTALDEINFEEEKVNEEDIKYEELENEEIVEEPSIVDQINMDELDSAERIVLIQKVKEYLARELQENESVIFKTVYFDFNSSMLSILSKKELDVFVSFLNEHPKTSIEIVGHTDNIGTWEQNIKLSTERAKEAFEFLKRKGIPASKLMYYGKGSGFPVANNETDDGRAKNRRVEVIIEK